MTEDTPEKLLEADSATIEDEPPKKKIKVQFSAKEFRKQLQSPHKSEALQHFLQLLKDDANNKNEYILLYLDKGGSPLEILQVMEQDPSVSPILVFEIVNLILLQINAKYPKYKNAAYDSCRYLLNTYVTLINKMLGLSSSIKERITILKLLTTIVTFSTVLAKDVLLHVNFNPTNLELLTKVTEGKNDVRNAFVHFIIAFLVDGHFPTLSVLLEKRGMMTSIINGLKYDKADTVVLILTAMKNHILENQSVSKTTKMKTFSTPVVKDIVNLYNWKGPGVVPNPKKKMKTITVDEVEKSKVNEAVHSFLLTLCTSKFGVIFRDFSIGLSKKNCNSLMYTILESLERPWEHSYASELCIKTCAACPDLTKTMWTNLKQYLEPRLTIKWLNAMKFAEKLVEEMTPERIEFCVKELQTHQISQIISILVLPLPILKVIIPENNIYENQSIKIHVMQLLLKMLNSADNFLNRVKDWGFDYNSVSSFISNHITRNFINAKFVLSEWEKVDELSEDQTITQHSVSDYLDTALELFGLYKKLAPQLLDSIGPTFDINEFLSKTECLENADRLRIKSVKLFFELEPTLFLPKTHLFQTSFVLAFQLFYENRDIIAYRFLSSLLKNCNIFDGYEDEIPLWINGILNLRKYDESVTLFFSNLVKKANQDASKLHRKLFELKKANFSPLMLILNDHCNENQLTKSIKLYLNCVLLKLFHLQVDSTSFRCIVSNLNFLSSDFATYIDNWGNFECAALGKSKGVVIEALREFSQKFLESEIENIDLELYPDFALNLLQAAVFYLTNLIKGKIISERHYKNCEKLIEILILHNRFEDDRYLKTILNNPSILHNFTLFGSNHQCTNFMLNTVKCLKKYNIYDYLNEYRRKIVSNLVKAFKNPLTYESTDVSLEILDTFELDFGHCVELIKNFADSEDNKSFFIMISYCLNKISVLVKADYHLKPLDKTVVSALSRIFCRLIVEKSANLHHLSAAFLNYLKVFPHSIPDLNSELFGKLISISEYHKDNIKLCEFLLERQPENLKVFSNNLEEVCSKRSFILSLLDALVALNNTEILEKVFIKIEPHILKALQKPHKAGQQFQNNYKSIGYLIEKFMKVDNFGKQVQKFETTEYFHVYLLKKVFDKVEKTHKILGNMITTFIHLLLNQLKHKSANKDVENLTGISEIFKEFLLQIDVNNTDLTSLSANESFNLFCKFSLKYGLAGEKMLLEILSILVELCLNEEDAALILEMFLSHSMFLDIILSESDKKEVVHLWFVLCKKFPSLMEKSHVPVLLSAYKATRRECDKTILTLLKMYESNPDQTHFYDFKPFLWGRSAASYYSIRSDVQKVLLRQPKMGDVLDGLQESLVNSSITHPESPHSYDLDFLLPLFSHLLSPENPVYVYHFTKSGALALTISALRTETKSTRLAACHVLSRFYFHLEARQSGKDNPLWIRFVEAICKGTVLIEDFKLNNFAAVYLARSALTLTRPADVMYIPLTQHLAAKDTLDFSAIPELYTLLHSPDVNSREHKLFILEIIRDGMKNEKDFTTFLKSMGHKLIAELCTSLISDAETKMLILDIFKTCCNLPFAVKILCGNLSFLSHIFNLFHNNLQAHDKDAAKLINKLLEILLLIVDSDSDKNRNFIIYLNFTIVIDNEGYFNLLKSNKSLQVFLRILMQIFQRFPEFLTTSIIDRLLVVSHDDYSRYLKDYGCKFARENDFSNSTDDNYFYLRLLFFNKFQ